MRKSLELPKLTLGVCYYPEHWDEEMWRDDLRRMKSLGLEQIRVAEFAWNLMEKDEGVFDFSFWDHFLDVAEEEDMKVVFCTPTATPPAWLTEKYPETLNADADGNLLYHGLRRHYNMTSPRYLEFVARLVEKMGEHFNRRGCIIGWQLDNEINCEINEYHAMSDHAAFRAYLREKFGTLDALNRAMGTVVWNQTYTDWEQIHLTRRTVSGLGHGNPHLELEERRFISATAISFMKMQIDILRKTAGDRFITTNGIFGHLDYQALLDAGLDFILYDNYPNFAFDHPEPAGAMKDRNASASLARIRAISPVFGIMEQQSGPGGWTFRMEQPSPKPGQMRLWSWQAIASGADLVSYFRWRTATVGTEIYWHGLNDYSSHPNRRIAELEGFHREVETLNGLGGIAGEPYEATVAILTDYDNEWDGELDMWHGPLNRASTDNWFKALERAHVPFDFVDIRDDTQLSRIESYSLCVYPHPTILTQARAELLRQYVERGGKLVMGARTGYKDALGHCVASPMPGLAGSICGVRVVDFTKIGPQDEPVYIALGGERVSAPLFSDILEALPGAECVGRFVGDYYTGSPAVVRNSLGAGEAWYVGSGFGEDTAAALILKLGVASPADEYAALPREVEVAMRGRWMFLLNYEKTPQNIVFKRPVREALTGETMAGTVSIPAYGVFIVERGKRA